MLLQPGEALRAKVGARLDAEPRHPGRGHRTDAMEALDREGGDEGETLARRDDAEAVRLVLVAGELGEEFVVGNPGRGGEAGLGANAGPDLFGYGGGDADRKSIRLNFSH